MPKEKIKEICDLYEWLPGYGESSVLINSNGSDLNMTVMYERELDDDDIVLLSRTIIFKRASYYVKTLFPGYSLVSEAGRGAKLGSLIEFTHSEWSRKSMAIWEQVSGNKAPLFRHFSVCFLSENIAFDVLAEEVFISEESACSL